MKTQTITILGLGRVGASIGMALKASHLDVTIIGYDRDGSVMKEAKERGIVDETRWRLVSAVSAADILILSLPLAETEEILEKVGDAVQEHTLVVGLSSLKAPVQEWAERYLAQGHYVGAIPVLAAAALSSPEWGLSGARPDLFQESVFCLTPSPKAEPKAVETAVNLGKILGAKPFFLDPAEYDSLAQGVQTLPGLMAAAIFQTLTKSEGWRDMLRFADSHFTLATLALQDEAETAHVAFYDREATLRWLDGLLAEVAEIRRWVAQGDTERLATLLEKLNLERDKWLEERRVNEWEEHVEAEETGSFLGRLVGVGSSTGMSGA